MLKKVKYLLFGISEEGVSMDIRLDCIIKWPVPNSEKFKKFAGTHWVLLGVLYKFRVWIFFLLLNIVQDK